MVKLGKMTVENFLSVGPKVELDFGTHRGVNYIFGTNKDVDGTRNGCGKSTFFGDALSFVMFGETPRKVSNKFITHRQMPKKDTLITLYVYKEDKTYYLEAGLRRGSGFFNLFIDNERGEMLNKSSIKETRKYFEREIIGFDYLVARSAFFLTSDENSNFLKMKKEAKRNYVESIFKLGVFGEMLKKARVDLNALDKEIAISQDATRRLVNDIKGFEVKEDEFVKSINDKVAACDVQIGKLMESKPSLEGKLSKLKETYASLPEIPHVPEIEYEKFQPFVPPPPFVASPPFTSSIAFIPPVVDIKEIAMPAKTDYSEILNKIDAAKGKIMAAKSEAEGNLSSYERNLKKCENIWAAVCDDCKPIISKMYDVKDGSYVQEQKDMVVKCAGSLTDLETKRVQIIELQKAEEESVRKAVQTNLDHKIEADAKVREAKNKHEDEVRREKAKYEEAELEARRRYDDNLRELIRAYDDAVLKSRRKSEEAVLEIKKKALEIEAERNKVSDSIKEVEKFFNELVNGIKMVEDKKAELVKTENPFKNLIEEYSVRLDAKNEEFAKFCRRRKLLDVITTIVGEDGVKKHILNDIVDIVNNRVQKYLYETGSSFTCVFDGSFNCEFITETGPTSYENFSSGEKARINLSILLTFRDILLTMGFPKMNVLVVDELIDSNLDSYAVNAVATVLKRITSTEGLSAYLISHRECFDDGLFEKVMEVVKQGGFTTLIEDSRRD